MLRSWLARLVDAEVRRLTRERDDARAARRVALEAAVRWHRLALINKARADALAINNPKESNTR
ncbi:hypothetical protein [Micromonospora carbonacea]|uniref:Uncharacterized protein n=1 Tax=Micromonospora carbonacea TaxID=47853 RepID=A0A1C4WX05_9ACTN|nr:hypothetical protein [Micromonospora carbonacea]SCF00719.1 hypothetical protein GA0070563_10489 [Micromonospora carbonacea]